MLVLLTIQLQKYKYYLRDLHKLIIKYVTLTTVLVMVMGVVFGVPSRLNVPTVAQMRQLSDSLSKRADSVRRDVLQGKIDGDSLEADSSQVMGMDGRIALKDSLIGRDSIGRDTLKNEGGLDAPIFGQSKDSIIYDVIKKDVSIFGQGRIEYENISLEANRMKLNTETKMVHAEGTYDSIEQKYVRPVFVEGQTTYDIDSMYYNLNSQKALISGVNTKEGDGILFGGTVKKMKDNVIHMHNGRYTTCDAECPHFYIQLSKGTVVPGKKIVFGYSHLVVEDVPIPFLMVPFGFFPQLTDRSSGVIFPEIGEERVKGFFVRNGGYYFVLNDNLDLTLTAGIYTLGSWQAGASSTYRKRYAFDGSFRFNYASDVIGEPGAPDYINSQNMQLQWSHRQDAKASPGSTFSASVNYASSSYNKYNSQTIEDYLNSNTSSTVAYQRTWAGTPFSLSVNGSLSQNSRDSTMSLNLPNLNFNVTRITPFKRKKAEGKERWYERISFTYTLDLQNQSGRVKEADFLKPQMFKDLQLGVRHAIPISASFSLFNYLNITPSFSYNERWYFRQINQAWDSELNRAVVTDTTRGFNRVWDYSFGIGGSTRLYGEYTMGVKKPIIIRHVMSPSFSFSLTPGFGAPGYGYYRTIETNDPDRPYTYSPYEKEMYGVPGRDASASLRFEINNTLQMKVPSKDTAGFKKITIFEAFNISSSYNFMADSLNLSNFNVSIQAPIVKGFALNLNMEFDPYQIDGKGNKINKFEVERGRLARLTRAGFSAGYNFSSKSQTSAGTTPAINSPVNNTANQALLDQQRGDSFFNDGSNQDKRMSQVERARMAATQYYDFDIPWNIGFNFTFDYSKPYDKPNYLVTLSFNASATITKKWGASFSAGYDFVQQKLTPGTVQITRDLHCWQMSFSWIPVGYRQSWTFSLRAKSSMLADVLKWDESRSYLDNYYNNR